MLFNSYIFILLFFPFALIGYYGLNRLKYPAYAKLFLIALSVLFCAYHHPFFALVLIGSVVINYILAGCMIKGGKPSKAFLAAGIIFNLALLFVFKYLGFAFETINGITGSSLTAPSILMPLGISYYTFSQISYLADLYKGDIKKDTLTGHLLFVAFFPKLAAGPIVRHSDLSFQFEDAERRKPNQDYIAKGICRFSTGLAKKVLLADTISAAVDYGYSNIGALSSAECVIVAVLYSLQLYFDFSGYCDMAIGIANCLHIDLPENFDVPYFASSITEFWKKWHITLTGFLTRYIYIPLGGNRKGKSRTLINILIVYLISGFWHGADWSFVIWGMMHGIACCLYRVSGSLWDRLPKCIKIPCTFVYVTIAWIFFRAESTADAFEFIRRMFTAGGSASVSELIHKFDVLELAYIEDHVGVLKNLCMSFPYLNMIVILLVCLLVLVIEKIFAGRKRTFSAASAIICSVLLIWSIISLSGVSVFLYFNF